MCTSMIKTGTFILITAGNLSTCTPTVVQKSKLPVKRYNTMNHVTQTCQSMPTLAKHKNTGTMYRTALLALIKKIMRNITIRIPLL